MQRPSRLLGTLETTKQCKRKKSKPFLNTTVLRWCMVSKSLNFTIFIFTLNVNPHILNCNACECAWLRIQNITQGDFVANVVANILISH